MGERKITILQTAAEAVAQVAYFIDSKGLPETAKRFVDNAFSFFESLANDQITHRPCGYLPWRALTYRCATFRKKYTVAYIKFDTEIVICDFALTKLLV